MTNVIAENKPLELLREDLGIKVVSHDSKNLLRGNYGTIIGYCQGLFNKSGSPDTHTRIVLRNLKRINVPNHNSHELIFDYCDEPIAEYVEKAIKPLLGIGRVPILIIITNLDPSKDIKTINEILETKPAIFPGETILVRLILNSEASIEPAANIVNSLLAEAKNTREMPVWWPVFQADFGVKEWIKFKTIFGDAWKYVNIAVNAFTDEEVLKEFSDNITIVQFLVGPNGKISPNGNIEIHSRTCVQGKTLSLKYNIFDYARNLKDNNIVAKNIICGPSLKVWAVQDNLDRVSQYVQLFKQATEILWPELDTVLRKELLALPA